MANRVTMTICGTEYILVAEEDAEIGRAHV